MHRIRTSSDLDGLRYGAYAYGVLSAWSNAGILRALASEPKRLDELPGDPRAIEATTPILLHLGVLQRDGDLYELSLPAKALAEDGSFDMGSAARNLGDLSRLDAVISAGGPVHDEHGNSRVTQGGVREQDPEAARAFMQMLYQRSAAAARTTVVAVRSRLPGAAEILDVGGGHGRYGAELAEAGYAVTLFDRPVCVAIARERYGDRIQYRAGDFMVDALGGPYDAALLSNIVHGFGFEENRTLLQHLRPALKPGGLVLVRDMFLDDYRAHPTEAAFFNLTMLMYTREGRVYPRREFWRLLETCGYRTTAEVVYHDSGHALLIAARP